jgi:gluconolactonase
MNKKLLLFLGVLCSLGFYACQKDIRSEPSQPIEESAGIAGNRAADPRADSNFYDPTGLISPFSFGKFDTLAVLPGKAQGLESSPFSEGPAVDKQGNVFFTDQNNDRIYKWTASTGQITNTNLSGTSGRVNGAAFDKDGNLIACADMYGQLWKIFPNGTHEVLANGYNGKPLNGPNDVWINPRTGGMYITDPIFPRPWWLPGDPRIQDWEPTHSPQASSGKGGYVYYLAPGSHTLVRVTTMPGWNADTWPNGVVGTPNGTKLYVNQWSYNGSGGIWSFDINSDGTLSNIQPFVEHLNFCDGMSMDTRGNIYICDQNGLDAFDKNGKKVLNVPMASTTNNVFGGPDEKTLVVTAQRRVFGLKMNVKGVEKY